MLIDEITKVADKDSSILPEMTNFLTNCSDKYHCTLFAASNHPLNIALPMEQEKGVFPYIVSMDPPDLKNKADIMKFYLNNRMDTNTDYIKLTQTIDKKEKESQGVFNIAQLKKGICLEGSEKKITEDEIINNIEQTTPNIDRTALDKFSNEIDILLKNEVKE